MAIMNRALILYLLFSFTICGTSFSQDSAKNKLILNLTYYNDNGHLQWLKADAKVKINGKFQQLPGIPLSFYINSVSPANLLKKSTTNQKGQAVVFIPPSAKDEWTKSAKHHFFVVADSSATSEAAESTFDLTKARINIDTAADKKIIATLVESTDKGWQAVPGVDLTIGVKRMGSDLNVTSSPTYTTDSLGQASADFAIAGLPGDSLGNIILVARVLDNDVFGNLAYEKQVPWGVPPVFQSTFNERSLFARRGMSPRWLNIMAWSIIIVVWFIIIWLFVQIGKLKKLGSRQP
jgi:hypothetical protein